MAVWNVLYNSVEENEEPQQVAQLEFQEDGGINIEADDNSLVEYLNELLQNVKLLPHNNPRYQEDIAKKLFKASSGSIELELVPQEEEEHDQPKPKKGVSRLISKVRRL